MGKTRKDQIRYRSGADKFDKLAFGQAIGRAQKGSAHGTPKGVKGYKRHAKHRDQELA